jgi:hypothetical protein
MLAQIGSLSSLLNDGLRSSSNFYFCIWKSLEQAELHMFIILSSAKE